ncbi:hypothetical protein C8J57DRAFT_1434869 [Mycena rebaudengoi]|nr:hypothetical protein C8J57DRAFT_1434869 [Mycena rebaudengoi]
MSSASSSSSSSSSSASPEPEPRPQKKTKTKSKAAEAAKAKKNAERGPAQGKDEGADPHWAYKPPNKSVLLEDAAEVEEFDWDALDKDEDLELWVVRIPEGVKPKYLESAQISLPPPPTSKSKTSTAAAKLGLLQRKHVAYDIWSVNPDGGGGPKAKDDNAQDDDAAPVGGEETPSLTCLLPRKSKKGKLYRAPRGIARHVVVSAQAVKPTPDPAHTGDSPSARPVYKNPPRECHPKELLKHRFMPYGSLVGEGIGVVVTNDDDAPAMDVDAPDATPKKSKKRKGEPGETPKKPKKAKTAAS